MGRNIEIKARVRSLGRQMEITAGLSSSGPERIDQVDTFFHVGRGRLKLRRFPDGSGELIQYERPDTTEPAESRYRRIEIGDPDTLEAALSAALGVRAVVRKRRTVYRIGPTRVHFDEVEDLGEFIELEVVLRPGEPSAGGVATAQDVMFRLGIEATDLVEGAYVDLLGQGPSARERRGADQGAAE